MAGVSVPTIANIERGETTEIKASTVAKLALALGVTANDLMADSGTAGPAFIDRFLASPWADDLRPTAEEISWLRSLPRITWLSEEPSNRAIAALLEARRSTK